MKFRQYFTMELVQNLMKKTSKYLIYSPLTEKVLTEWHCQLYKYFQCEYLQVSPQVTLASRHLILWSSPSPHWPPPPHWPRSSEARTQCPAPSRRGTRIKLSTKFSDSFDIILRRPLLWPSPFNRFNRFIHSY